eukprot:768608-Hanusia_phi.AAC.1
MRSHFPSSVVRQQQQQQQSLILTQVLREQPTFHALARARLTREVTASSPTSCYFLLLLTSRPACCGLDTLMAEESGGSTGQFKEDRGEARRVGIIEASGNSSNLIGGARGEAREDEGERGGRMRGRGEGGQQEVLRVVVQLMRKLLLHCRSPSPLLV